MSAPPAPPGATGPVARRLLIAGNWKMNHTHLEAIQVVRKLCLRLDETKATSHVDVSVHPAFVALRSVQTVLESEESPITLGAQSCHPEDSGAFTGEISAKMLAKLSVTSVIVGHSERRRLCGEDDALVRAKAEAVIRNRMVPIVCVGETLEEREAGETDTVVTAQVVAAVNGMPSGRATSVVFAYEPLWAIGTGRTAAPEDAQEVCAAMRAVVEREVGANVATGCRILYGGSVKPANAGEIVSGADVDGLLVGGASLDPDEFSQVISSAAESAATGAVPSPH